MTVSALDIKMVPTIAIVFQSHVGARSAACAVHKNQE
jgi:hypothetical protein